MSGNGFSVKIKALKKGAAPAPAALYDELYSIIDANIRRAAKGKAYAQVTSDFLSLAREDGAGRDDAIDFGFHDSGGVCSASVHACDHWFSLHVAALARPRGKAGSALAEIAARHGLAIAQKLPTLESVLKTCREPLIELRRHLFGIGIDQKKAYLVSDDLDDRIAYEDLTAQERAKVDDAVKNKRCACRVCEALRASPELALPKAKKAKKAATRKGAKGKAAALGVKATWSSDKEGLDVYDLECSALPDGLFERSEIRRARIYAPITTLPDACERLTSLQQLYLCNTRMTEIPPVLARIPSLTTLAIVKGAFASPAGLANLPWLEKLVLDGVPPANRIDELPLAALTKLTTLDLLFIGALPKTLGDATGLRELSVLDEALTKLDALPALPILEDIGLILRRLETFPSLAGLSSLTRVSIKSGELRTLPELPRGLKTLTIDASKLEALPDWFGELTQLEELYLACDGLTELPTVLGRLPALRDLTIKMPSLEGISAGALSRNLEILTVLDAPRFTALPDSLGELASLTKLSVLRTGLVALPESLRRAKELTWLDLSDSPSFGALPAWVGDLEALEHLVLQDMPALGPLPDEVRGLKKLGDLRV